MRKQVRGAPSAGKVSLPPLSLDPESQRVEHQMGPRRMVRQGLVPGGLHLSWLPTGAPSITLHRPGPQLTCP